MSLPSIRQLAQLRVYIVPTGDIFPSTTAIVPCNAAGLPPQWNQQINIQQVDAMPHSSDDVADPQYGIAVDLEIASLLSAIEQEKAPDRLTKLAIELQIALVEKRRGEIKN